MRLGLRGIVLTLAASAAGAVPPALVWPGHAPASKVAILVVTLDADGASLVSSTSATGPLKLRPRAPEPGGTFFVVRDESGAPLLVGETFDADATLHGDDPDEDGALRATSVERTSVTFSLKVPRLPDARDVVLARWTGPATPSAADVLRAAREGDADWTVVGRLELP
jgi:hypothetical protein